MMMCLLCIVELRRKDRRAVTPKVFSPKIFVERRRGRHQRAKICRSTNERVAIKTMVVEGIEGIPDDEWKETEMTSVQLVG